MEDLQSLMACLDDISSKIGDGMYLHMADKLKNIHNELNGNRPFHEDTFYYSDEDEGDEDSDSDYEAPDPDRTRRIERARAKILQYVRCMHDEFKHLRKWEKVVEDRVPYMKRMTATRKADAIWSFCSKFNEPATLVSREQYGVNIWSWRFLREHGLRALVSRVGTDEEKEIVRDRGNIFEEEISIATMGRITEYEKTIYADYMREVNDKHHAEAEEKLRIHRFKMHEYETFTRDEEIKLRGLGATVYERDHWRIPTNEFWANVDGPMVDDA